MRRLMVFLITLSVFIVGWGGAFFVGTYYGYTNRPAIESVTALYNKEEDKPPTVDFSVFWEAWKVLDEKYVDTNSDNRPAVTDEQKVWGAIQGLTQSLGDPYTVFLPPEEKKQFEDDIAGNFSGVGMEIGIRDGQLTVVAPLPNTPAKKAGILAGDRIIKIDGEETTKMNVNEAVKNIRGPKGEPVTLTIKRGESTEELSITIVRDDIQIPTIDTELLAEGIFVIRLYNFSAPAPDLFRKGLEEFIDSGANKLILDLRGNPGGYLEAAIHISSWFLPDDKTVVVEKKGQVDKETVHKSYGFDVFTDQLKMVVLIDQGSASASEIVAGALRGNGAATLIGQKTFGKGSVQELVSLSGDTSLKVTVARWYTPDGHSISADGLEPDIVVDWTEEDAQAGRDPQLSRAIDYLTTGR
ncbi:MAG: S41 family peptidase [Candidatus Paceibacterota bacterium]